MRSAAPPAEPRRNPSRARDFRLATPHPSVILPEGAPRMPLTDDQIQKRAAKRQFYENYLKYSKAPNRTIPDSWEETYVLTPKEVATNLKPRDELEEIA